MNKLICALVGIMMAASLAAQTSETRDAETLRVLEEARARYQAGTASTDTEVTVIEPSPQEPDPIFAETNPSSPQSPGSIPSNELPPSEGTVPLVLELLAGMPIDYSKNDSMAAFGAISSRTRTVFGIQAAGISAETGMVTGTQMAGISTTAVSVQGSQIAGISSTAGTVRGAQISGISNTATRVDGAQIAGIINKAEHVTGVQIGLVNISNKLDGLSIGLVTISTNGIVQGRLSLDENRMVELGFQSGSPKLYTYIHAAIPDNQLLGFDYNDVNKIVSGLSIGSRVPLDQLWIDMELGPRFMWVAGQQNFDPYRSLGLEARVSAGITVVNRLGVWIGYAAVLGSDQAGLELLGSSPSLLRDGMALGERLMVGISF